MFLGQSVCDARCVNVVIRLMPRRGSPAEPWIRRNARPDMFNGYRSATRPPKDNVSASHFVTKCLDGRVRRACQSVNGDHGDNVAVSSIALSQVLPFGHLRNPKDVNAAFSNNGDGKLGSRIPSLVCS